MIHQQDVERCIAVLQLLVTILFMSVQEMLKSYRTVAIAMMMCERVARDRNRVQL